MTDREKQIVEQLNHPLYTVDFLEEWKDRDDSVFANAPAALQAMGANGFYEAVRQMAAAHPFSIGDRFRDEFGTYTLTEIEEDADGICYYTQPDNEPGIKDENNLEDLKEMELLTT